MSPLSSSLVFYIMSCVAITSSLDFVSPLVFLTFYNIPMAFLTFSKQVVSVLTDFILASFLSTFDASTSFFFSSIVHCFFFICIPSQPHLKHAYNKPKHFQLGLITRASRWSCCFFFFTPEKIKICFSDFNVLSNCMWWIVNGG